VIKILLCENQTLRAVDIAMQLVQRRASVWIANTELVFIDNYLTRFTDLRKGPFQ
jgi:hypothetical protein